jgi:hypothetical protein
MPACMPKGASTPQQAPAIMACVGMCCCCCYSPAVSFLHNHITAPNTLSLQPYLPGWSLQLVPAWMAVAVHWCFVMRLLPCYGALDTLPVHS